MVIVKVDGDVFNWIVFIVFKNWLLGCIGVVGFLNFFWCGCYVLGVVMDGIDGDIIDMFGY